MSSLLDDWHGIFRERQSLTFLWCPFADSAITDGADRESISRQLQEINPESPGVVQSTGFLPLPALAELWRLADPDQVTVIRNGSDKKIVSVVAPVAFLAENISRLSKRIDELSHSTTITLELDHIVAEGKDVPALWEVKDDWYIPDHELRHLVAAQVSWQNWPESELLKPLWFRRGENSPIGLLVRLTEETNNTSSPEPEGSIRRWTRSDIDVVAVTTDRFRSVKELLKSSRHILGDDVGVTVVVQQPESWRWRRLAKRFRARLLHVDDDSGLSWSRNHGVTNTTRPLIFLMDDDFQLDDRCRIDAALDILTCDDEISVLGGNLLDVHHWRDPRRDEVSQGFAMRMVSQPPELEWLRVEDAPRKRVFHTLTDYVEFCDIVDNFALIRRDRTFDRGVWWNPDLKIGAEHQDFYLRFNEKGIGSIARTNVLKVRNVRVQSARFRALRGRTDTFFRVFFEDWGLRSFRIIGERTRTNTADGGQAYLQGAQESPNYVARQGAS